ncbi:hypothetical protein [Ruegeria sp. AU67]|uniref:hypothetical protein n=1 Tax=Ruegeria sp. AU67 TaxID=2108530 RepID=UPI001357234A|nr:hypothetical protein [Ruegeria sp. AU67]
MAKNFHHPNPRSRKPSEFAGTWKGRAYRRGVARALLINLLVFFAVFTLAVYVVQVRENAQQNPKVWTLGTH